MEIDKKEIQLLCLNHVEGKMLIIKNALDETQSSSNTDTKSSAGDKHETSRAMAHIENERLAKQLNNLELLHQAIRKINIKELNPTVGIGSYVITKTVNFYISVGLGKIKQNNIEFYAIAIHSPVGKSLIGKKVGDQFVMGNKKVIIENLK